MACTKPDISLRVPGKLEQAVTLANVVSNLGATATLVKKGGAREAPAKLTRGDDGVTFSGFIAASPGQYTLEITFDGVVTSTKQRHFLGRLTSDSFTVTQGATATPTFNKAVDTVGKAADHGDDDADGLGFLDELLLGTDTTKADTDGDGVKDGVDCKPTDSGDKFVILAGGSVDDCDGDGFNSITALLGAAGIDCNDEDATINPGVHDDCSNTVDEDCNPQTCPVDDSTGPTVELISPADGATIGCNTPFVVHASDASDVANVLIKTPDEPLSGGTVRQVALIDAGDHLTWNGPDGFGIIGSGLTNNAPLAVDVAAIDTRGNPSTIHANYQLVSLFPTVTMTGPSSIIAGQTAHYTITPTGSRPLSKLEVHAAAFDPSTTRLDMTSDVKLATLAVTGGSVDVDPATLPGNAVVYPIAVDDIGNTASPLDLGASYNPQLGINAGFFCDNTSYYVPAASKVAGVEGPITVLAHLQDAIDIVHAQFPTAYLTEVFAIGIGSDGKVDLTSTTDFEPRIVYDFMTPEAYSANGCTPGNDCNATGPQVNYFSAAFSTLPHPDFEPTGNNITFDEITNTSTLKDSDAVAAAWHCGGNGPTGNDNDNMEYTRDVSGAIPNTNEVAIFTNDGFSFTTDADNLSAAQGFCCTPTGCT